MARRASRKNGRKPSKKKPPYRKHLAYELEVSIIGGPVTEEFIQANPKISRTIEIRGHQTLEQLHWAIFDAFGRDDDHMYQFEFGGERPMDPKAREYVLPMALDDPFGLRRSAGTVTDTRIGSLGLKVDEVFFFWFDFGDDWWHRINVLAIREAAPGETYPRVTRRVGGDPPQYPALEEDEDWELATEDPPSEDPS